jgi:hypothetical protein
LGLPEYEAGGRNVLLEHVQVVLVTNFWLREKQRAPSVKVFLSQECLSQKPWYFMKKAFYYVNPIKISVADTVATIGLVGKSFVAGVTGLRNGA